MPSTRSHRPTLVGCVAGVVVGVSLLSSVGYRFDGVPTVLLLSFATLGGTLGVAFSTGAVVVPLLACLATLALVFDPLFGPRPPTLVRGFTADAVFLAVCTALASTGVLALRRRDAVRARFTRADRTAALAGAVVLCSWHVVVRPLVGVEWPNAGVVFVAATVLWTLGGAAISGAVAALGWHRSRLVTPAFVVVGTTLGSLVVGRATPDGGIAPTLFTVASIGWFVPLAVALAAGWCESWLRDRCTTRSTDS